MNIGGTDIIPSGKHIIAQLNAFMFLSRTRYFKVGSVLIIDMQIGFPAILPTLLWRLITVCVSPIRFFHNW